MLIFFCNRCLIVGTIISKHERFVNMVVAFGDFTGVDLVEFCRNGVDKWGFWRVLGGAFGGYGIRGISRFRGFRGMKKPPAMLPRALSIFLSGRLIYTAQPPPAPHMIRLPVLRDARSIHGWFSALWPICTEVNQQPFCVLVFLGDQPRPRRANQQRFLSTERVKAL